jgi:hypothetical protein
MTENMWAATTEEELVALHAESSRIKGDAALGPDRFSVHVGRGAGDLLSEHRPSFAPLRHTRFVAPAAADFTDACEAGKRAADTRGRARIFK